MNAPLPFPAPDVPRSFTVEPYSRTNNTITLYLKYRHNVG